MGTRSGRAPLTAGSEETTRHLAMRSHLHRWVEAAGAQLLVVDPLEDDPALVDGMASRGVHVTWVGTTTDGLIAFGRLDPQAVVVSPEAPGLPVPEFVAAMMRHSAPYVLAALADGRADDIGEVMLAGARGIVPRPYSPAQLWELLVQAPRSLVEHARLEVGPIELDAMAYSVRVNGERIADLPLKEFELLRALMLRAPGVVTDDELRDALWGSGVRRPGGNTIAMHVTRLRARLAGAVVVRRIRGRGYSLTVDPE